MTSTRTDRFTDAELDEAMALNALAPIQLARGIIAMMENANRGYIINIASRAGLVGFSDKGIYGASKAAAIRFFDAVYAKYLDSGVRVTSICPGWINTPMATAGGCEKAGRLAAAAGYIVSDCLARVVEPAGENT